MSTLSAPVRLISGGFLLLISVLILSALLFSFMSCIVTTLNGCHASNLDHNTLNFPFSIASVSFSSFISSSSSTELETSAAYATCNATWISWFVSSPSSDGFSTPNTLRLLDIGLVWGTQTCSPLVSALCWGGCMVYAACATLYGAVHVGVRVCCFQGRFVILFHLISSHLNLI